MGLLNVFKILLNQDEKKFPPKVKKRISKKSQTKVKKKVLKKTKAASQKKTVRKISPRVSKKTKNDAAKIKQRKKPLGKTKETIIGTITHYFGKISVGVIKLKSQIKLGDKIHIRGVRDDFRQIVSSIQLNHKDIPSAKKGVEVGIKVVRKVHQNDKVYKIIR